MSFGIIDVITLLLGMAGFGLTPNPHPPTADQALRYAIADADIVAHIDAASLIPRNYKLLSQLADQPQVRSSPELKKLLREVTGEIEGARGIAKLTTGIDATADIADATAFLQLASLSRPSFVVAVHGKFSSATLEKIAAAAGGVASRVDAGAIVDPGAAKPAIGLTRDGVMLIGTAALVRERLADGWQAPSHASGTSLGYAAEVIGDKPVFAMVAAISQAARGELRPLLPASGLAPDLLTRHRLAALSVYPNGVGWTWIDSTRAGFDAMDLVSSGVIDLLRSTQIGPRGIAKIALGALESYRSSDPQIEDALQHKAELMKLLDAYTSDGSFKVAIDRNPRTLRLAVRATGKTASEVVPVGLVMPAAVLGYLTARDGGDREPAMAPPPPLPPVTAPPMPAPAARPPGARPPASKPPGPPAPRRP